MPPTVPPKEKVDGPAKDATRVKTIPGKKPATHATGSTSKKGDVKQTAAPKIDDDLDDIFAAKGKKTAEKSAVAVKKGPTMEEIKAEEAKYKGVTGKGGRNYTEDGLPIYTEEEMEEEMGEKAWENFIDAAEPAGSITSY